MYNIFRAIFYVTIITALSDDNIPKSGSSRIMAGKPCSELKVDTDYFVRLEFNNYNSYCTGALLSRLTVITAQHCFVNKEVVYVLIFWNTPKQIKIPARKYLPLLDDLGLMKLDFPVPASADITYPQIPTKSLPDNIADYCPEVLVAGYGRTVDEVVSSCANKLMCVYLPAQSYKYVETFKKHVNCWYLRPENLTDVDYGYTGKPNNHFCSSAKEGKSACLDDSGGPVMCTKTGELIGVSVFGTDDSSFFVRIDQQLQNVTHRMGRSFGLRIKSGFSIWFTILLVIVEINF